MILIDKIFVLLTIAFYHACAVCCIVICVNGRYSLLRIQDFISYCFCQGYIQQMEIHQFSISREINFLYYINGELNLDLFSRNLKGRTLFMQLFVCFKHLSIINSHHLFLVRSQVFNSSIALMLTFLDLFLSFFLRFYENYYSCFLEEMLLCELIRSQLYQIWFVH